MTESGASIFNVNDFKILVNYDPVFEEDVAKQD